jgi:hypothetical protein
MMSPSYNKEEKKQKQSPLFGTPERCFPGMELPLTITYDETIETNFSLTLRVMTSSVHTYDNNQKTRKPAWCSTKFGPYNEVIKYHQDPFICDAWNGCGSGQTELWDVCQAVLEDRQNNKSGDQKIDMIMLTTVFGDIKKLSNWLCLLSSTGLDSVFQACKYMNCSREDMEILLKIMELDDDNNKVEVNVYDKNTKMMLMNIPTKKKRNTDLCKARDVVIDCSDVISLIFSRLKRMSDDMNYDALSVLKDEVFADLCKRSFFEKKAGYFAAIMQFNCMSYVLKSCWCMMEALKRALATEFVKPRLISPPKALVNMLLSVSKKQKKDDNKNSKKKKNKGRR